MESVLEYDDVGVLVDVVDIETNENQIVYYKGLFMALMNKVTTTPLYVDYELLDHQLHPDGHVYGLTDHTGIIHVPYGPEEINYYDANSVAFGGYYPYMWNHLEISTDKFFQGLLLNRQVSAGDDLKRMYNNGVSCLSDVVAGLSTTEGNLLGLVCIPRTDRLN